VKYEARIGRYRRQPVNSGLRLVEVVFGAASEQRFNQSGDCQPKPHHFACRIAEFGDCASQFNRPVQISVPGLVPCYFGLDNYPDDTEKALIFDSFPNLDEQTHAVITVRTTVVDLRETVSQAGEAQNKIVATPLRGLQCLSGVLQRGSIGRQSAKWDG
jgi:hypothetical protein